MSRRAQIRALAGLVNAQARASEAELGKARVEFAARCFADQVAQRDRFIEVLDRGRAQHAVQVFEYRRLLQQSPRTDGDIPNERNW